MIEWWPIRVTLPGRSEVISKRDGCLAARSESETKSVAGRRSWAASDRKVGR